MGHYCVTPLRLAPVLDLASGQRFFGFRPRDRGLFFLRLAALLLCAPKDRSADAVKTYACSGPAPLAAFEVSTYHQRYWNMRGAYDTETERGTVPGLEFQDECSAEPSIWKAL